MSYRIVVSFVNETHPNLCNNLPFGNHVFQVKSSNSVIFFPILCMPGYNTWLLTIRFTI